MAEQKKKQEEGFGAGLLGGLKQIGSDLMDFLQTPEAMQFGRGILNSKSPGVMGMIGDGYDAYQGARKQNAEALLKQQMHQLDAALKMANVQKIYSEIGDRRDNDAEFRAYMGMGGGTPSSGGGAPTLADYQNSNLKFLEAPSGSTQQSGGDQSTSGYQGQGQQDYEAKNQQGFAAPRQQFGQGQQQASFSPQGQNQALKMKIAKALFREGKYGEGWKALSPDKESWEIREGRDPNTGQPVLYEYNKETRQRRLVNDIAPTTRDIDNRELREVVGPDNQLVYQSWNKDKNVWEEVGQGSFRPKTAKEENKYLQKVEEAAGGRHEQFMKDISSKASTYGGLANKSEQALIMLDKNPNLRSGPGTEFGTTLRNAVGLGQLAGQQELFQKLISQLLPEATGMLREGGVQRITQGELLNLVPNLTATLANSPQGIKAILGLNVAINKQIQRFSRLIANTDHDYRVKSRDTGKEPFNLDDAMAEMEDAMNRAINKEVMDFVDSLNGVKK
jgi:hypothetical protein